MKREIAEVIGLDISGTIMASAKQVGSAVGRDTQHPAHSHDADWCELHEHPYGYHAIC